MVRTGQNLSTLLGVPYLSRFQVQNNKAVIT